MDEDSNTYQHLESLLRHVPVVLFVLDEAGTLRVCNGTPLQHVVPPHTALIGRSVFDIERELTGDNTDAMEYMRAALAGEIFTAVVDMYGRIFQTHYEPLRSASGALRGVRGIALDITEQVVLAERLARAGALPRGAAAQLLSSLPAQPDPTPLCTLTVREREVMQRVAAGMSNCEIAADLVMSPATVKWHLGQVYQKLAVRNRTAAVTQAQALGLAAAPARRST